ncbi:hypothetical protein GCM10023215_06880 [Pseudonocardia yuanmonensis]|uniref:Uncharacterized protein n=1 Tax=Pseudonocardia yuanmonensis TaxID=1095914 RepID=A0ABP8W0D2_9PSEU
MNEPGARRDAITTVAAVVGVEGAPPPAGAACRPVQPFLAVVECCREGVERRYVVVEARDPEEEAGDPRRVDDQSPRLRRACVHRIGDLIGPRPGGLVDRLVL